MSIRPNRALGWLVAVATAFGLAQTFAPAQGITIPNTFTNDTTADAPQVNANFAAIAAAALNRNAGILGGTLNLNGQTLSGTATASGAWTFSGSNTASGTWGFSNTVTHTGPLVAGDLRGTVETITATGSVNDQALGATTTILRLNNATALTLTGLTGCSDGRVVLLESIGAGQVNLVHQSASSTAGNRFINFATSGNTPLAAGVGMAELVCDGTTARWRMTRHEQGAWITPTFAAGDYTAVGGGTWTVGSGDVTTQAYRLSGRTLQIGWTVVSSTVAGTVGSLSISNAAWGGFTNTKHASTRHTYSDNGGAEVLGSATITAAGTVMTINRIAGANWTAATDTTSTGGQIAIEVN